MRSKFQEARAFYDSQYGHEEYAPYLTAETHPYYSELKAFVTIHKLENRRCLEIGCGRGAFQNMVADYTGCDASESVGRYLRKPFVMCDAGALPFESNRFDAVWTIQVLEHVPDPEMAFREIARVLKPGGVLLLAPAWHTRSWFAGGYPVRPYSKLSFTEKVIKASIPVRDSRLVRGPKTMLSRMWACVRRYGLKRSALRFRKLSANYETFWMSDSDACNSFDPVDCAFWFLGRGWRCLSPESVPRLFLFHGQVLVLERPHVEASE